MVSSDPIEPISVSKLPSLLRISELDANDGNIKESLALSVEEPNKEKKTGPKDDLIVNSPTKELPYEVVKYSRRPGKARGTLFNCPLCVCFHIITDVAGRNGCVTLSVSWCSLSYV